MLKVVSFADLVGRVSGLSWLTFKQRAQQFAAQRDINEPVPVDSLGTLLWDLDDSITLSAFQEEFAEACSVPCLVRPLADLRALANSAEATANERFAADYNMFTQRIAAGDEVWELGVAMSSCPFVKGKRFKSRRIEILKSFTPSDLVVLKLRLKPPGSRLDWGKSVAKVLSGIVPDRRAVVMSRGMVTICSVFATAASGHPVLSEPIIPPEPKASQKSFPPAVGF